ncbi:Pvc16 family protein [Gynuella sp.]|uniref:Pvc16 family protein n=1 Tax=Gynuella sp. TaxID=2969146 RepID=UPI003D11638E
MDPLILHKVQQTLQALIERRVLALDNDSEREIELSFVAPDESFVSELSTRPVINCYLIGIAEDRSRRRSDPVRAVINNQKTESAIYQEPRYVDISYMLTVWSKDKTGSALIEHLLIGYLITGLGYFDFLPTELQQAFQLNTDPFGIRMTLFGSEHSEKVTGQVWQAMGSTPKPSLMLSLSIPVTIAEPGAVSVVREIDRAMKRY